MRPGQVKAAKTNCGENCACARPHPQMHQRLSVPPRPARVAAPSQHSTQPAVSVHTRQGDRLTLQGELDQGCFADRPYESPAPRGDAFSVPNDSSTVACVFQAARAIPPGNPPGGKVRSEK